MRYGFDLTLSNIELTELRAKPVIIFRELGKVMCAVS